MDFYATDLWGRAGEPGCFSDGPRWWVGEGRGRMNIEELLAKAKKPSADAMALHPFYRGKVETALKCTVRSFNDFAIWYTPGVAAPCRAIAADPELVYEYTNKW